MIRTHRCHPLRGLTLLELMFAVAITTVVGAAITVMLGAVAVGVDTRRDSRSLVIRSQAAQSRLSAYIVPSRALLEANDSRIVVWFEDSRESATVHGSEIRWLLFDHDEGALTVHYVKFPETWTTLEKLLADHEHPRNSDWMQVLASYDALGHVAFVTLVDEIAGAEVSVDGDSALASRHVALRLTFEGAGGAITSLISGTLRKHAPPVK